MLTYETLRILKNLLVEISSQEQKIELIRQRLAQIENFEPYAAFQRIDRNRNDYIVASEVIDFLRENKIYGITFDESEYIIKFFDSDEDMKLCYADFLQMLVPCDNQFLRCSVTQKPTYKVEKYTYLPTNIEQELTNLIFSEIEFFRKTEEIRKELERRHDFSTYACFRAIDEANEGDVNPDNLRQFFKNNGYYPTEDEVIAIVRRLDVDADCKISYEEFCEGIKTQEFTKKAADLQKSQQTPPQKFQGTSSSYGNPFTQSLSQQQPDNKGQPESGFQDRNYEEKKYQQQPKQLGQSSASGFGGQSQYREDGGAFSQSQMDKSYQSPQRQFNASQQSYYDQPKRQSPLRPSDENELIKAFKQQLILDRDLEKCKVDLLESCQDFNLFEAFRMIDREQKGYISIYDIKDACDLSAGLDLPEISLDDIKLFMARHDKNKDGIITFSEFSSAFAPVDPYLNDKANQRKSDGYQFSEKTKFMYRNLWINQFKIEQQAELIRQKLNKSPTFNVYDAFKAVDANDDGRISRDELKQMIEGSSGFFVTSQELNQLMERYDKNGDGVISYSEFSDEIRPHSPKKSSQY